ncbi:MAG: BA14K family protein [Pseudomonadota bacterium]
MVRHRRVAKASQLHIAWCNGRYRTYRVSDNSYAYKVGKRTRCRSPYSR